MDTNGTAVLTISGDVDRTGADRIHAAMHDLLTAYRPTAIRIDLGQVTFMSQAGAGTIVAWRAAAAAAGTPVGVCNAAGHIARQVAAYGYRDLFD